MEGLQHVAGADVTASVAGCYYVLRPLRMKDFAAMEAEVARLRRDPLADLSALLPRLDAMGLDPERKQAMLVEATGKAQPGPVTGAEIQEFMGTPAGLEFLFGRCSGKTPEESRAIFGEATVEDIKALSDAFAVASGITKLEGVAKNSPEAETQPRDLHESRGLRSISA